MKILLAYTSGETRRDDGNFFLNLLPVGLCSIHSLLRSSAYDVHLANLSCLSERRIDSLIMEYSPTIVGLSQWTHNRHETVALSGKIKKLLPDSLVVLGGAHASAEAESIIESHPEVDIIVCGEGESTFPELLSALKEGRPLDEISGLVLRRSGTPLRTPPRPRITDLDSLPYAYRFLDEITGCLPDEQGQFVSTARGCPSSCRFCGSPAFWGRRVVSRSPESVLEELLFLRDRYGIIYISMRDDTFTIDRNRIMTLCTLLSDNRAGFFWNCQTRVESIDEELLVMMKKAGCECVQLGVESGSPKMLDYLGKKVAPERMLNAAELIHRVGLTLSVYIISGVPGETDSDREMTRILLKKMRPHDIQVAPLAFYPGTEIFSEYMSGKLIDKNLFDDSSKQALLVDDHSGAASAALLKGLVYDAPAFTKRRTQETESMYGYSAVSLMQLGDYLLESGRRRGAEEAYMRITSQEPSHPWGWQLLAEMYQGEGRYHEAASCYERLLKLIPAHRQAREFLAGNRRNQGRR